MIGGGGGGGEGGGGHKNGGLYRSTNGGVRIWVPPQIMNSQVFARFGQVIDS